jgi:hypothetical protein
LNIPRGRDLTKNSNSRNHITDQWRPLQGFNYPAGTVLQRCPLDLQIFVDLLTCRPCPAGAQVKGVIGVVSGEWLSPVGGGFDGLGSVASAASTLARGTQMVDIEMWGQANILVDLSGNGSQTITDETVLVSSQATPGYAQSVLDGTAFPSGIIGYAALPAAGFGSSITAGALAPAAQTETIAGAPAAGNVIGLTFQVNYSQDFPGIVQTKTDTITLTAATAASATTAAAALVAALNADAIFAKYYIATNAAGVITITAVPTGAINLYPVSQFNAVSLSANARGNTFAISGSNGNYLTVAAVAMGGGATAVMGGATLAGGTGYLGTLPCFLKPACGL